MCLLEQIVIYINQAQESDSYAQMLRLVLAHLDVAANGRIQDLAAACYTSPSSITRLCSRLGYDSFSLFRADLQESLHNYDFYNHTLPAAPDACSAYADFLLALSECVRNIDRAVLRRLVERMHESSRIVIFQSPILHEAVDNLLTNLAYDRKPFLWCHSRAEQEQEAGRMREGELALFISTSQRRAAYLRQLLQQVGHGPAATALLYTGPEQGKLQADEMLLFRGCGMAADNHFIQAALHILSAQYRATYIQR